MYGLRLCSHVRPQTPVTYKQDNCRANTPTDKDKDLCQYACNPNYGCADKPTTYKRRIAKGQTRLRADLPTELTLR